MIRRRNSFVSVAALIFIIITTLTSCTSKSVEIIEPENETVGATGSNETSAETVQKEKITIGFENWRQPDEFTEDIESGIFEAEEKFNMNTILFNSMDIDVIDNTNKMLSSGIKGAIEYYRDPISAKQSISVLKEAGIPVVSIDYPVSGSIYAGIDNYEAGIMAGRWLGDYAIKKWAGNIDLAVIVYSPLEGEFVGQLFQGIEKGLKSMIEVPEEKIARVDGGGKTDQTIQVMESVLSKFPGANKILIGVGNDACAIGALTALDDAGKNGESVIIGQGTQKTLREIIMKDDTPIKAGVAHFPEKYGEISMQAIQDITEGKEVPYTIYVDAELLTKENMLEYYPQ